MQSPGILNREIIWQWLEQEDITQTALAKRMGVNLVTLNRILNGRRRPSIVMLRRIADATGISTEILLSRHAVETAMLQSMSLD